MPDTFRLNPLLSHKTGATEIYLIRHADALPGPETVIPGGGYDDQPLSELGQRQAVALGAWLAPVRFDAIYSSPLRRTRETASPLATYQNREVRLEPELREVRLDFDAADFVGGHGPEATINALRARMTEIVQTVGREGRWSAVPGSESSEALRSRAKSAVIRLASSHPAERIALVSHGGFINAFLAELLGLERDYFFPIHNTSVSIVRTFEDQASLYSINEVAHLRELNINLEEE